MYPRNNISRNRYNMQNYSSFNQMPNVNNQDRFLAPFILGGITGSLLTPRYNNPIYVPGPLPYYPQPIPVYPPQPYYQSTTNYY